MFLELFQTILLSLIFIQIFFGGFAINWGSKIVNIQQVDIAGILLLVTFFVEKLLKKQSRINLKINKYMDEFFNLNYKFTFKITISLILFFSMIHFFKHISFKTHGYDMAFINHAVFNMFDKPILRCDVCLNNTYMGEHSSFILFLLAPIYFLKSNFLIFLIQSICLLAPIFLFSKYLKSEKYHYSFYLLILLLSSRTFRNNFIWDFREDNLSYLFIAFALYFYHANKKIQYVTSLFLAFLCKENVTIIMSGFSIFCLLDKRSTPKDRLFFGIVTLTSSLIFTYINFNLIIPTFTYGKQSQQVILLRFGKYGSTPKEILINMLTTPKIWMELVKNNLLTYDRIKYVGILFIPFSYFLLKDLFILIPILLGIAMNILPESPAQRMMIFHYDLIILPFFIFAFIRNFNQNKQILKYILLVSICISGVWPITHFRNFLPSMNDINNYVFLQNISKNQITLSNYALLPQFTYNRELRAFKNEPILTLDDLHGEEDRGKKKGSDSSIIIIDKNSKSDIQTLEILIRNNFELSSKSNDNRFLVFKNKN